MYGQGGFTCFRTAWRLNIDSHSIIYGNDIVNNALKFLGLAITLWFLLIDCKEIGIKEEIILSLADNTSATTWVFQSSLKKESLYCNIENFIVQKVAEIFIKSRNFLSTQHIYVDKNLVCDWITFKREEQRFYNGSLKVNPVAYDCPFNDELTDHFHSHFPQLIRRHFKILHLPKEVILFTQQSI